MAVSSATTTEIVAAVPSLTITVCGYLIQAGGTSPTLEWETGTKTTTACDTGTKALSGALAPVSGNIPGLGNQQTNVAGASGGELCAVSGGTTPTLNGYVVYVQQ